MAICFRSTTPTVPHGDAPRASRAPIALDGEVNVLN
jgi:hypothetical protein